MKAKRIYVYRSGMIIPIREGETEQSIRAAGYFERHPDTIVCSGKPPSIATINKWMENGIARAIDNCKVEPDGTCPHGKPSWILAMGYI